MILPFMKLTRQALPWRVRKDSYAQITKSAEVIVCNLHISPYDQGNRFNHEPLRDRKLLLHKAEIRRLIGKVKEKGYTLVPLKMKNVFFAWAD